LRERRRGDQLCGPSIEIDSKHQACPPFGDQVWFPREHRPCLPGLGGLARLRVGLTTSQKTLSFALVKRAEKTASVTIGTPGRVIFLPVWRVWSKSTALASVRVIQGENIKYPDCQSRATIQKHIRPTHPVNQRGRKNRGSGVIR